jgi:hypothetical protein
MSRNYHLESRLREEQFLLPIMSPEELGSLVQQQQRPAELAFMPAFAASSFRGSSSTLSATLPNSQQLQTLHEPQENQSDNDGVSSSAPLSSWV